MTYNFDRFLRYDEMVSWLHDLQKQFPGLVALETYGKSHKGRDLWIATVTDTTTGAHNTKPAHWIDANIHATEVTGGVAALYIIHHLVTKHVAGDATVREALRTQWAVTLGLIPALLVLFQQFSLVSPLANAVAIPLISLVVTPLALVGSLDREAKAGE